LKSFGLVVLVMKIHTCGRTRFLSLCSFASPSFKVRVVTLSLFIF